MHTALANSPLFHTKDYRVFAEEADILLPVSQQFSVHAMLACEPDNDHSVDLSALLSVFTTAALE